MLSPQHLSRCRLWTTRPRKKSGSSSKYYTSQTPRHIFGEVGLVLLCAADNLRGPSCRVWLAFFFISEQNFFIPMERFPAAALPWLPASAHRPYKNVDFLFSGVRYGIIKHNIIEQQKLDKRRKNNYEKIRVIKNRDASSRESIAGFYLLLAPDGEAASTARRGRSYWPSAGRWAAARPAMPRSPRPIACPAGM